MDPYKVLHLEPGADKQVVKRAYFRLVRQYRPEEEQKNLKKSEKLTNICRKSPIRMLPKGLRRYLKNSDIPIIRFWNG
ncbi:J domain-containing protein [Clostridium sp. C105KSO13]|uniref:J domain-containing protein n=1 Tax=Clostridium sp. C105KSO13 TaxID=1776045 RepID=UPI0007406858|nr:J domain-containing protein [Clostridium sp. C105KSO13]CUX21424.1 DnaJ domain protein [Clostridium sp. C105KSO13]